MTIYQEKRAGVVAGEQPENNSFENLTMPKLPLTKQVDNFEMILEQAGGDFENDRISFVITVQDTTPEGREFIFYFDSAGRPVSPHQETKGDENITTTGNTEMIALVRRTFSNEIKIISTKQSAANT